MNSEKVKEIRELLLRKAKEYESQTLLDILTLINELESENERLMKLQARGGCRVAELGIENQQLKDRIVELEKENEKLLDSVETVQNDRCVFKCELTKKQLKQFAERLKEKLVSMKWAREDTNKKLIKQGATIKAIDELLKEYEK